MSALARRRNGWLLISAAAAGTILVTSLLTFRGTDRRPGCAGSLIPAYLPPSAFVDLADSAPGPRLLVVNPASGPGGGPDPVQRHAIERAQARGARVLGYVASTFGRRDPAAVMADAEHYRAWYGVDGIFLDEVAHGEAQLPYYRALSRRLRAGGESFLVFNPGTVPARGYFALADVVVTFEGPFADYAARGRQAPAWLRDVPITQTAHLVYAASRAEARSAFAAPRRAGYLYLTSGTLPDPWGTPPPYLREEETAMGGCASAPISSP